MHRQLQKAITADRLPDHSEVLWIRMGSCQRLRIETGKRVEAGIQLKIVVWGIETGVVEDVECVGLEFQRCTFSDFKFLENREIKPGLERSAENVAARAAVAGFLSIASDRPCGSRTARRNSTLAGAEEWNGEIIWVDIWNPDSGKRPGFEGIAGPPLSSLLGRDSRSQRKNWIGNEVVGTEENTGSRSREVDDAERLATLGHGDTLKTPAIR